jgi:SPP1 family predicted phage head-tail adaptor
MAGIGSMYRQKISDMRHRITVQTAVQTIDASRQKIVSYVNRLTSEPATFEEVTGGEVIRGKQIEAGVTAVFKVNAKPGYSVQDRILFNGQTYGIVRVEIPSGIERFIHLYCKAAPVG